MNKKDSLSISNIIKSGFSPGSSGREAAIKHKKMLLPIAEEIARGTIERPVGLGTAVGSLFGGALGATLGGIIGLMAGHKIVELTAEHIKSRKKKKKVIAKTNIQIKKNSDQIQRKRSISKKDSINKLTSAK